MLRRGVLRGLTAAFVLFVGTACAGADETAALGQRITDPSEITGRMAGNTLSGVLKETGTPWTEYYCDTGRSLYEFGIIARGKWWTQDSKVCFAYEYDNYKKPICFEMFGQADGSLAFFGHDETGQPMTFMSGPPVRGDPLHLEERAERGCELGPSV